MSEFELQKQPDKARPWALRQWHYIVMVGLTVLFYFPLVLPGMGLPAGGDFFAFHTPYRIFTSQKLHQGIVPLYAHEIFAGYPIFQDPQFALLYPVNLLFGMLVRDAGSQTALDAYMLINLLVLSVSTLFFMRSFGITRLAAVVAAAVACFNGFIVVHVTHINMLQVLSMSLLAAGMLARFGRSGAYDIRLPLTAGIALAFGNMAGHPQTTMYTHYAIAAGGCVLALRLWKRTGEKTAIIRMLAAMAVAVIFGLLLAAVQLVPTAELLRVSTRASVSRAEVLWSGLDLSQLPSVLFPGLYMRLPWGLEWPPYYHSILPEDPRSWFAWLDENFSEGYAAVGAGALLLGLVGWITYWRSWPVQVLGWGSLFLLGCATGDDLPFYGWLYEIVPGFDLVRVSTRILLVFFPAWGLLAGLGVQALLTDVPQRVNRAGCISLAVLIACIAGWLVWALKDHNGNWVRTWIEALSGDEEHYIGRLIMEQRGAEFMEALQKQFLFGCFILFLLGCLLVLPWRRHRRMRTGLVAAAVALELTVYCFGWATAINYPGITDVQSDELRSLPSKLEGRAVNFTAPNTALYMGRPVANGYSVTVDDWVTAFQPDALPPFRLGMQETLLNLWNVSDIIVKRNPREAKVGDALVAVDDWGWTEIGSQWVAESGETSVSTRAVMPRNLTLDFETTRPVKELHLVAFSGRSGGWGDGTEIARVIALGEGGRELTSAVVVLGKHVSDPRYPLDGSPDGRPAHSRAPLSYYRIIPNHWSSGVSFFDARLELLTTTTITSLTIEAIGPYSTTLGINSAAAILDDGSIVLDDFLGVGNFYEVESLTKTHRVVHREDPPGYVRMLPTATAGSYKRTDNIMWRMFNGQIDAGKNVIIDKRKFNEEELRCVNAPHAPAFRGTAEIEWLSDRHGRISTSSNMHGWLFLSQVWDAGWRAEVDGEPAEIYRANGPFMALPLTGGEHEVHIRYRPTGLVVGTLVSAAAAVALAIMWLRYGRRRLTKSG